MKNIWEYENDNVAEKLQVTSYLAVPGMKGRCNRVISLGVFNMDSKKEENRGFYSLFVHLG